MLIVVSGPGGYGKDTIANQLVREEPDLVLSRSWTTRPRRPGEPDDAYTFVDRATFEAHAAAGGFIEWAEYHGELYGTPAPDPADPRHIVLVIEVQGAQQILETFGERATMILIEVPSPEVQEARLRKRGDDDEAVRRRVLAAEAELAEGRRLAHFTVVNDDLDRAVAEVRRILAGRLPRAEPPA